MWEHTGLMIDGAVWFRRVVEIPAAWAGRDLLLSMGALDDFGTTLFNGEQVGATGMETPNWWVQRRQYRVPGKLVQGGKAVIATRIFDQYINGGFAVAGADCRFVWASAQITGADEVTVWAEGVKDPKSVQYAWGEDPSCNLGSDAGLPASPFRA